MHTRTLKIVVASGDRANLRHVNKFLTAFGYEVLSAVDVEQAVAALQTGVVDFLIVDDRLQPGGIEVCNCLQGRPQHRPGFTFLLTPRPDERQVSSRHVAAALAAGVDDFLTRPLVYGEWLARLRAAARALENRRRYNEQTGLEPVTQLPSKSSFQRQLTRRIQAAGNNPLSCALLDLDFFRRLKSDHGRDVSKQLLEQVARQLGHLVQPGDSLASFGNDRFAVVMDSDSENQAVAEMERICASLADHEYCVGELKLAVTASAGVACRQVDESPDDLLLRAERALDLAKSSGRNCVVCDDQFRNETKAWHELAGRLFETTKARDVMTPCPVTLKLDDPFHKATEFFEKTELLAIPVVDSSGNFAGIVWRESFINGSDVHETYPASYLNGKLGDQIDDSVPWVEEETSFSDLVERLSDDSPPLLVVADAKRPTGLVTAPGLASLSRPLAADSFQGKLYDATSRYLAVAE